MTTSPVALPLSSGCSDCAAYQRAEKAASAEYDYSKATDCRVLLARHRKSSECSARGSS
ncbi:hypothetical protein [Streptomyces sp. BBFR102]|uniref:hypothetical protein n=1 Tax=Streptomyces sp. BBFR102 TaxID=3448171 RepID=UPI003F533CD6